MQPPPILQPEFPARSNRVIWFVVGGAILFTLTFFIIFSFCYRQVVGTGDVVPNPTGATYTSKATADGNYRVTFDRMKLTMDLPSIPQLQPWDPIVSSKELGKWGTSLTRHCSWDDKVTVWITTLWLTKVGDYALHDPQQRRGLARDYLGSEFRGTMVSLPSKPPNSEAVSFVNTLSKPPVKSYCLYVHHNGTWIQIGVTATDPQLTVAEFNRIVRSINLD